MFASVVADHAVELPANLWHKDQDRSSHGEGGSTTHLLINVPIFHSVVYSRDLLKILVHLGPKGITAIPSGSCVLSILPASVSEHVAAMIAPTTHSVEYVIAYYIVHHALRSLRVQL